MARFSGSSGVPDNPVIEGNITATTAVTLDNGNGDGSHQISSITATSGHGTALTIAGDFGSIDTTRTDFGTSSIYSGLANTDGLGTYTGTSIDVHSAQIYTDVDVATGAELAEVSISAQSPVNARVAITSQMSGSPAPVDIIGNVAVDGSIAINGTDVESKLNNPSKTVSHFDDLIHSFTSLVASSSSTGDATIVSPNPTSSGALGIQGQKTGTGTHLSTVGWLPGQGTYKMGSGYELSLEYHVKIPTASDETQKFYVVVGMGSANNPAQDTWTHQASFVYSPNTGGYSGVSAQPYWQTLTRNGNAEVNQAHSQVTATTDWTKLKVVVNSAGTEVKFYVDDVLVATHTSWLPPADTAIQGYTSIKKTLGNTSRELWVDYLNVSYTFPTAR